MEKENVFKWKHYQPDIILLTVRWYLRYSASVAYSKTIATGTVYYPGGSFSINPN